MPSPHHSAPLAAPAGRAVHILDQDARLHLTDGLLTVERPGQPPLRLRLPEIGALSIHGRASLSTPCLHALLAEGIPVTWRSDAGYLLGQTAAPAAGGSALRRAQYAAAGTSLGDDIARRLIAGKLANQRAVLRRRIELPPVAAADRAIAALMPRVARAEPPALLGLEGAAGAAYFGCWPALLRGPGAALPFPGRNRRPPRDPINAALSYAYAVLAGDCAAAAQAAGLDPAEGILHAPGPGRPALALDLMEPFRPLVADRAVLFAFNTGMIGAGDWAAQAEGVLLAASGRRALLAALAQRMEQSFATADGGETSYREALTDLGLSLARALRTGAAGALAVPVRR